MFNVKHNRLSIAGAVISTALIVLASGFFGIFEAKAQSLGFSVGYNNPLILTGANENLIYGLMSATSTAGSFLKLQRFTAPSTFQDIFVIDYQGNITSTGVLSGSNTVWTPTGNNIYNSNSGNVGVGTTSPGKKLDIIGDFRSTGADVVATINASSGYGARIDFQNNGTSKVYTGVVAINNWGGLPTGTSINDGFTRFDGGMYTFTAGTTRHVLSMLSSGNVGIGTTDPRTKLEVGAFDGVGASIVAGNIIEVAGLKDVAQAADITVTSGTLVNGGPTSKNGKGYWNITSFPSTITLNTRGWWTYAGMSFTAENVHNYPAGGGNRLPASFLVEASSDGVSWTTVEDVTGYTSALYYRNNVFSGSGRWVRITARAPQSGEPSSKIANIQIFNGYRSGKGPFSLSAEGNAVFIGGNVGIDVTQPTSKLSVSGGTGNVIYAGGGQIAGLSSTPTNADHAVPLGYLQANYVPIGAGSAFVQGGNSFGAAASLGTNDNNLLNIETNNTVRMTIAANGNVGIGTTAPNRKLDVVTSINTDGIRITGSGANASLIINNSGAGGYAWDISSSGAGHLYGNGKLFFGIAFGVPKVTFDSSGNVGIGTTAPIGNLHISQNGVLDGTWTPANKPEVFITNGGTSNSYYAFGISNSAGPTFAITNAGNVGIGTTTPVAKLAVSGGTGNVIYAGGGQIAGLNSTPVNSDHAVSLGYLQDNYSPSSGSLWSGIQNGNIYNGTNGSGNVGIGTTNPGQKLDIIGGSIRTNNQLISTVAVGTAPIAVTSHTVVANLNADLLDGYNADQLQFYQSNRNFIDGTLIQSDIDYSVSSGEPFLLEIEGNSYGSGIPFDVKIQGYIYSDTIINKGGVSNGTNISGIVAFNYNGKLCFWFPRQAYWQGFSVFINSSYGGVKKNRLVSISNSVKPAGITKEVSFTISQSIAGSGTANYITKFTGIYSQGNSQLFDNGTNVGIATTSPVAKLAVSGGTGNVIYAGGGQIAGLNSTPTNSDHAVPLGYLQANYVPIGAGSAFVQGGNSFGTTATLGTNDNNLLNIETNNAVRMTVAANGNVGIGTTAPVAPLNIVTTSQTGLQVNLSNTANGTAAIRFNRSATNVENGFWWNTGANGRWFVGQDNDGTENVLWWTAGATGSGAWPMTMYYSTGDLSFHQGTSLYVKGTGNVGIGTTAPNYKLEIAGTSGAIFSSGTVTNGGGWNTVIGATAGNGLVLTKMSGNTGTASDRLALLMRDSTTDAGLLVLNNGSGTTNVKLIGNGNSYINSGNVGIGTANPTLGKLQVQNGAIVSVGTNASVGIHNPANEAASMYFNWLNNVARLRIGGNDPGATGGFDIQGPGDISLMRILGSGNVGIATTSPVAKLAVSGGTGNVIYAGGGQIAGLNSTPTNSDHAVPLGYLQANYVPIGAGSAFVQGGNSFGTTATLGTNDNNLLNIETNNAVRMTVAANGNVGIGITNPSAKLYVNNTTASQEVFRADGISGGAMIVGTNSTTWANSSLSLMGQNVYITPTSVGIGTAAPQAGMKMDIRSDSGDGNSAITAYGYNGNGGMAIRGYGYATAGTGNNYGLYGISYGSRAAGVNIGGFFEASGAAANYALITGAGNVGIGVTNPQYAKLELLGNMRIQGQIEGVGGLILDTNNSSQIAFEVNNSEKMRLTTGGDLLMNTTTSIDSNTEKLAIKYVYPETGVSLQSDSTNNHYAATFRNPNGLIGALLTSGNNFRMQALNASGSLDFLTNGSSRLYINETGNVGIGSTTPVAKLAVSGGTGNVIYTGGGQVSGLPAIQTEDGQAISRKYLHDNFAPIPGGGGYLPLAGGTMTGDINMGSRAITNVATITAVKLNVNTIDPLYSINGNKYSTYVASIVGRLREEYIGRLNITERLKDMVGVYEGVIDFDKEKEGSDLWVWREVVDFQPSNVDVLVTPYGGFAQVYYIIDGNKIRFRSDRPAEISYRLVGHRFDWREWPTFSTDQSQPGYFVK